MSTPNTTANGGQILTDERIVEIAVENGLKVRTGKGAIAFARAIEADLRAALAAPANVPQPAVLWVRQVDLDNLKRCGRGVLTSTTKEEDWNVPLYLSAAIAVAQPAAQGALTEDEQLALMVKVEDYIGVVDWAGTQTHAKCDAAESAIFAKVNEIIQSRATPVTDKTAEKK